MSKGLGANQRKILLLLFGGIALGLTRSPKRYFRTLRAIKEGLKDINEQELNRAIRGLYKSKLISEKQNSDGTITFTLTNNGKNKALSYNIDKIEIKKSLEWDKKWRIVLFDIPEKKKKVRDALRHHLKRMEFYEFQKSVFISPWKCKNEIDYIIEFYNIRKNVRFIAADAIDNELHLKKIFKLV